MDNNKMNESLPLIIEKYLHESCGCTLSQTPFSKTLHEIFENTGCSFFAVDRANRQMVCVNDALNIFTEADQTFIEQTCINLFDKDCKVRESAEFFHESTKQTYQVECITLNWFNNRPVNFLTFSNISALKEKIAENASLSKSSFLLNLGHEVRTPMNSIIGFLDFLDEDSLSREERRHYMQIIKNNCNQLLQLFSNTIDGSKSETKEITLSSDRVRLNELMNEIHNSFEHRLEAEGKTDIEIILSHKGSLAKADVIADEAKLNQLLSSLISNAMKYTQAGYIKFWYQHDGNMLHFIVRDTGIGMDKEKLQHLFSREKSKSSNELQGETGLSLPVCKNIVELMGGAIWVDSNVNAGSAFHFTIPYVEAGPEAHHAVATSHGEQQSASIGGAKADIPVKHKWSQKRVLLAEDDLYNSQYMLALLSRVGISAVHAVNGSIAVEEAKKHNYDLILMDVKMPVMDGLTATKIIKSINPHVPIVIQTAFAMTEDSIKAQQAGCDYFITKPISKDNLFKIMEQVFG